ncbi:T7SS effector LXG polymorphic toxin [Halalkalibacter oceani]|uniref:T7SS effector LXG polymorphic toxin n=1 Tax=Halalkalibacter oceani TaxID=1653776 RepID=UPI0033967551
MKTLVVSSLHHDLQSLQTKLHEQAGQMARLEAELSAFISIDSFEGEGGGAIRNFFQECHLPFLRFFQHFLLDYQRTIQQMINSLEAMETAQEGVIQQSYLDHNIQTGIEQAKTVITQLTDSANQAIQQVGDILFLPRIQDEEALHHLERARQEADETVEKLLTFDHRQTSALTNVAADLQLMKQYVTDVERMFQFGRLTVNTFHPGQLTFQASHINLRTELFQKQSSFLALAGHDPFRYPPIGFPNWFNPTLQPYGSLTFGTVPLAHSAHNVQQVSNTDDAQYEIDTPSGWAEAGSFVLDFIPIVGNIKAGVEAGSGSDPITGRELEGWEQGLAGASILLGGFGKLFSRGTRAVTKLGSNVPIRYDDRVIRRMREDGGTHHNFPSSFDQTILSKKPAVKRADGREEFLNTGSINGQPGVYHITIKDDVITHRSFIPESDWQRYSNRWGLPSINDIN